jgi:diacylglycerol kinase family enzyme
MRVGLVYNEKAGNGGALSRQALIRLIRQHGHEVAMAISPDDDWTPLFDQPLDAVAAAGGDGTVAAVAKALVDRQPALLVLPMGTANNIGSSLGLSTHLPALVAGWSRASRRPLDVIRTTGPWGERLALESVGGGLVTHGIVVTDRQDTSDPSRDAALERALGSYVEVLRQLPPTCWELTVDGEELTGDFLMLEALNMGAVGPNVMPAFDTDWGDGQLSLVTAGAEHRDELLAHVLERRRRREAPPMQLPTRQARSIVIHRGDRLHVDDEVFGAADAPGRVTIELQPGGVRVML